MADHPRALILRHIRKLVATECTKRLSDRELLQRFTTRRDETAFATLVQRHGPMVLRVCQRLLHSRPDAEDACQATFLVLARKARTLRWQESVAPWLYRVAYHLALKAKAAAARRAVHEGQAAPRPPAEPLAEITLRELQAVLDEEVARLPEKYRAPLVLCCLEGMARDEAAQQLGWPLHTLKSRLEQARERLRSRLARRGLMLSTALSTTLLTQSKLPAALPAALAEAITKVAWPWAAGKAMATGTVSATVAALAEGGLRAMFVNKVKIALVLLLAVGVTGTGGGILSYRALAERPAPAHEKTLPQPATKEVGVDKPKEDRDLIQGTWVVVSMKRLGEKWPDESIKASKMIFAGDTRTYLLGTWSNRLTFRLNPIKNPKEIDLISTTGGTSLGIYELNGDTLKLCPGDHYGNRPTNLEGQGAHFVYVLKKTPIAQTAPEIADKAGLPGTPDQPLPRWAQTRYENAPGCSWMKPPTDLPGSWNSSGVSAIFEKDNDGALLVTLAHGFFSLDASRIEFRPVAFDAAHKRYLFQGRGGGGSGGPWGSRVALGRYRLDPNVLPANKVTGVGIEVVTPQARQFVAVQARERARNLGLEVLPPPRVGDAYEFALTTLEGKKIRSQDLRGKVVLIDCWATWCSPCMAKMPKLKEVYDKRHKDGFEIVGVNFDHDPDKFKQACQKHGLTWPQFFVPSEKTKRDLWEEAAEIHALPTLLLVDRDGILRACDDPNRLEEQVAKLLDSPRAKPRPESKP